MTLRWENSSRAPRATLRKPSASRSSRETPTIRQSGMKPELARWNRPGMSFRRERSPVAPTSTTRCGYLGPTRPGTLAAVLIRSQRLYPSLAAPGRIFERARLDGPAGAGDSAAGSLVGGAALGVIDAAEAERDRGGHEIGTRDPSRQKRPHVLACAPLVLRAREGNGRDDPRWERSLGGGRIHRRRLSEGLRDLVRRGERVGAQPRRRRAEHERILGEEGRHFEWFVLRDQDEDTLLERARRHGTRLERGLAEGVCQFDLVLVAGESAQPKRTERLRLAPLPSGPDLVGDVELSE